MVIGKTHVFTLRPSKCMLLSIPITISTCDQQQHQQHQANDRLCVRPCVHNHFHSNEKCLTLYTFACIYKLMYTYVYTYNHTNMFLGCQSRGPRPWYGLGSPRARRNWNNWQVAVKRPLPYYLPGAIYPPDACFPSFISTGPDLAWWRPRCHCGGGGLKWHFKECECRPQNGAGLRCISTRLLQQWNHLRHLLILRDIVYRSMWSKALKATERQKTSNEENADATSIRSTWSTSSQMEATQ